MADAAPLHAEPGDVRLTRSPGCTPALIRLAHREPPVRVQNFSNKGSSEN